MIAEAMDFKGELVVRKMLVLCSQTAFFLLKSSLAMQDCNKTHTVASYIAQKCDGEKLNKFHEQRQSFPY